MQPIKEERKEKEEGRRKKKRERRRNRAGVSPALALPDLAGARLAGSRWVSSETHGFCAFFFFFFFFFFFPAVGLAASPRRRSTQTPRNKSTTGHRDSRLGLAGRGSGFFLVLG
jgi:hypothetical protein